MATAGLCVRCIFAAQQIYNAHTVPLSPYNSQLLGTALQLLILMFSSSFSSPYKNTNWWWFHSIVRCYTLEKTLFLHYILLTWKTIERYGSVDNSHSNPDFLRFSIEEMKCFLKNYYDALLLLLFLIVRFFFLFPNSFSFQPLNELEWTSCRV
jgi:hypothetical protein